jgi:tRNA A37 threonylcarbamoyladenosine modification protein TsaB
VPGRHPRARFVAKLGVAALRRGAVVSAEAAQPVYLRDRVAWASGKGG